jgi:uncharacterized membrane protein YgcG
MALFAGVAAVALLPLYGDVRPSAAVSHPEWARMVLRGLDLLADAPGVNDTAAQAFATLSGRDSRSWPADRYVRGQRVETFDQDGVREVRPSGGIGEAVYALGIARQGDYRLRLNVSSPAPAEAELTKAGSDEILRSFSVPAGPVMGWIDVGEVHLDPGAYDATVLLPEGSALERVELAPPCVHPIEPRGGWKATAVATTEDVAITVLQALNLESELPPAASPIEFRGDDLRLEDGTPLAVASPGAAGAFRGGARGSRAVLVADIPETGLYTLSVFGVPGGGQRWMADSCRKCVVCPSSDPLPRWRVVLSGDFQKGRHLFSASLGPDAVVERIRLEQKKDTPLDYVAVLGRLGLELGPPGPITRERAEDARRFLERRRVQQAMDLCGDILRPGTLVAELSTTGPGSSGGQGGGQGGGGGGGEGGGGGGGGEGGGGVPPPILPPLPPPSPVLPDRFAGGS